MSMTKEELARLLNGHHYGSEISTELETEAKTSGLVVLFGGSDDLMEFRGAIYDEQGAPSTALVDAKGLLIEREQLDSDDDEGLQDFFKRRQTAKPIESLWSDEDPPRWSYKTEIPHATFEITEDGEQFCRGIVFSMADLPEAGAVDYAPLAQLAEDYMQQYSGEKETRNRVIRSFLAFAKQKLR